MIDNFSSFTKQGYQTYPSIENISRMNDFCKTNVLNFKIFNRYGEVFWPGVSDIREFDFNNWIKITQNFIEVYPDKLFNENRQKPERGTKLNKTAILIFYMKQKKSQILTSSMDLSSIKKKCTGQNCEFVSYDVDNQQLKVITHHFTKFEFLDEDDEEELPRKKSHRSGFNDDINHESHRSIEENKTANLSIHSKKKSTSSRNFPDLIGSQEQRNKVKRPSLIHSPENGLHVNLNEKVYQSRRKLDSERKEIQNMTNLKKDLQFDVYFKPQHLVRINLSGEDQELKELIARQRKMLSHQKKGFIKEIATSNESFGEKANYQLNSLILNKISKYNEIQNKDIINFLQNDSKNAVSFSFRTPVSFCWTSDDKICQISNNNSFESRFKNLEFNSEPINQDFVEILSKTFKKGELNMLSNFQHGISNKITFCHSIFLFLKECYQKMDLKLDQKMAHIFAYCELFLDLFVCNKTTIKEILQMENIPLFIDQELQSLENEKKKNTHGYHVNRRRKLFKWIENIIYDQFSKEEGENLTVYKNIFAFEQNQNEENQPKNLFFSLKRLLEKEDKYLIDKVVSTYKQSSDLSKLTSFESAVLNLLTMYIEVEQNANNSLSIGGYLDLSSIDIELNSLFILCLCAVKNDSIKKTLNNELFWLQKQIGRSILSIKVFDLCLLWQILMIPLFPQSNQIFDKTVCQFYTSENVSEKQVSKVEEILNVLKEPVGQNELGIYEKDKNAILKYLIDQNKAQILRFYSDNNMNIECVNFLIRNLCQIQLEDIVKKSESRYLCGEYMMLLSVTKNFESNPLIKSIKHYFQIVEIYLDYQNKVSEESFTNSIKNLFHTIDKILPVKSEYCVVLEGIHKGLLYMVLNGIFDEYPETKKSFLNDVVNNDIKFCVPKEKFDETIRNLSFVI